MIQTKKVERLLYLTKLRKMLTNILHALFKYLKVATFALKIIRF